MIAPGRAHRPALRAVGLAAAVASGGCSFTVSATDGEVFHGWGMTGDETVVAAKAVRASASRDIPCPIARVAVTDLPAREDFQAGRTIVAEGCGQRLTYLETCAGSSPVSCGFTMTGRLGLRPGATASGAPPDPRVAP